MGYFIRIFAKSRQPITCHALSTFIIEGMYFDEAPEFDPFIKVDASYDEVWDTLTVRYRTDKRPILIMRNVNDDLFKEEVQEVRELIQNHLQAELASQLDERLAESNQVIVIEVDREGLSEAAWEMLATLESYLATTFDGLIYAPEDGIYDRDLKRLVQL